jgi:hypothetical protein
MWNPRPKRSVGVKEIEVCLVVVIEVGNEHPPAPRVLKDGWIDSWEILQQSCSLDPSIRKALSLIQCHLARLILLGHTVPLTLVGKDTRVG